MRIYTIGHSTLSKDEFTDALHGHQIEEVLDVRSMPGSNRYPHFNKEEMEVWLPSRLIEYQHVAALGGRRTGQDVDPDVNAGWSNRSFRNYADYTCSAQTDYWMGLGFLMGRAMQVRVAIMCSEAVPWRCHRSLISNNLVADGADVTHIVPGGKDIEHVLGAYGPPPKQHPKELVPLLTYPKETS